MYRLGDQKLFLLIELSQRRELQYLISADFDDESLLEIIQNLLHLFHLDVLVVGLLFHVLKIGSGINISFQLVHDVSSHDAAS